MAPTTWTFPILLTTTLAGLLALAAQPACGQALGGQAESRQEDGGQAGRSPTRIMLMGDSITQSKTGYASYRYWLWNDLEAASYDADFVGPETANFQGPPLYPDFDQDHAGFWGMRADWLVEQLQTQGWATTYQPDVVLLFIGVNDLFKGQGVASTLDDIGNIVDELRLGNRNVSVVLGQLYEIPAVEGSLPFFLEFNEGLAAIALAKDTPASHVYVSDQRTGFDASVDTYDGVHPNQAGEQKIASRWQEVLLPILDGQQGTWTDMGGGTAGAAGRPALSGSGPLTLGSVLRLQLIKAAPSAFSLLFVSVASTPTPFLGGTLHAFPYLDQVVLFSDHAGQFSGATTVPALPAGTDVWFQIGIEDASVAGVGASLSNGLRMTTP